MERYLITYGPDNELALFDAKNMEDALEQFIAWADFSDDYVVKKTAVNDIYLCVPFDWTD